MALINCSECQKEISSDAASCPHCGKSSVKKDTRGLSSFLILALLMAGGFWFFGGGFNRQVDQSLQGIHDQVATDAVEQYTIAANQGDKMQKCVQAGLVSAAFLQAKDDANYNTWKAIESVDCAAAGLPR